jgi:stage III sporulation protein AB
MKYSSRVTYLDDFIDSLQLLKSEISYRKGPLPEALEKVGKQKFNSASLFFIQLSETLKETRCLVFADCWKNAVDAFYRDTSLKADDIAKITDIGAELGMFGPEGQEDMFSRVFKKLDECLIDAKEEKKTKGKMFKCMGVVVGIVLVIILV